MVVSTPAKACDAHGHCFKEALRCSMASVSQTCSSVKRLSHEATALCRHTSGTLANLGANNSVQQRSDDTCFGRTLCLRQCSFEISACRPYEGNEEPLEAPRISTHSQAAAMPSLEEISSVSTAELETAETCKIVRIFSSLQQGKLAANIHSPEQENTACTPVRLVWGQRGNEIWHLIGCNEGRQNVVYRASRCRPLVRAVSADGAEFAADEGAPSYLQQQPSSGTELGVRNVSASHPHVECAGSEGEKDCCRFFQQREQAARIFRKQEQSLHKNSFCFEKGGVFSGASEVQTVVLGSADLKLAGCDDECRRTSCIHGEEHASGGGRARSCSLSYTATDSAIEAEAYTRHLAKSFPADGLESSGSIYSQQQSALTVSSLPSREALVRRLLPASFEENVARRMKSSIEGLYDDSIAAIQSSQARAQPLREGEAGWLAADCVKEGQSVRVGPFSCSSRTTTAASCRQEELSVFGQCGGEDTSALNCDEQRQVEQPRVGVGSASGGDCRQAVHVFGFSKEGHWEAEGNGGFFEDAVVAGEGDKGGDVMFLVREEWEVFMLHYCSRTGIMRAVAFALNRVTTLNKPPDLCKKRPAMALGGDGCQQCCEQLDSPCKGWWRSRYVLLRVTVTLADRSAGLPTIHGLPPCCCPDISSANDNRSTNCGKQSRDLSTSKNELSRQTQAHDDKHPSLVAAPVLQSCTTSEGVSPEKDVGGFPAQLDSSRGLKTFLQQDNSSASCEPRGVRIEGERATRSSMGNTSLVEVGPGLDLPRLCGYPTQMAFPLSCLSRSTSVEAMDPLETSVTPSTALLASEAEGKLLRISLSRRDSHDLERALSCAEAKGDWDKPVMIREVERRAVTDIISATAALSTDREQKSRSTRSNDFFDTLAFDERRSRLASLLSSPCDSFEGFGMGASCVITNASEGTGYVPFDTMLMEPLPSRVPPTNTALSGSAYQRFAREDLKTKSRGHRLSISDKGSRARGGKVRGTRVKGLATKDRGQAAVGALDRYYAACARTIGREAVAEARNSILGMCGEERALAAVFLDFVMLVAPEAADAAGIFPARGRRRQATLVSASSNERRAAAASRPGYKRKLNVLLRVKPWDEGSSCARAARTAGFEDAACAARVDERRWVSRTASTGETNRSKPEATT